MSASSFILLVLSFLSSLLASAKQARDGAEADLAKLKGTALTEKLNQHAADLKASDPERSKEYAIKALKNAYETQDEPGHAHALLNLSEYYLDRGLFDSVLYYSEKALLVGTQLGNSLIKANAYSRKGTALYFKGNLDQALLHESEAIKLYTQIGDRKELATSLNAVSYIYAKKGWYERALEYRLRALEIRQGLGNADEIAKSLNSLGDIYFQQGNFYKALKCYQESFETSSENGNIKGLAISIHNIAKVYDALNEPVKALENHRKALALKKELGNLKEIGISNQSIGNSLRDLGQYEQAIAEYQKAISIFSNIDYKAAHIRTLLDLSEAFRKYGKPEEALSYAKQACQIAEKIRLFSPLAEGFAMMAQLAYDRQDASAFLEFTQKERAIRDSMQVNISSGEILALQQRYEDQKIQEKLALIEADRQLQELQLANSQQQMMFLYSALAITIVFLAVALYLYRQKRRVTIALKEQNEEYIALNEKLVLSTKQLELSNTAKDKLFAIVSHDIRSPLDSLTSLLALLSDQYDRLSREEALVLFQKASQRVGNLNEFMNNLLQWARIQSNGLSVQPSVFSLSDEVCSCVNLLSAQAESKQIDIECAITELIAVKADRNMMSFVFRNLIANAIKFTGYRGTIRIFAESKHNFWHISVRDSGIGMTPDEISQLFLLHRQVSRPGTNNEKGTGLGLIVCKEFVEKNGGTLAVESRPGVGSTFTVSLPQLVRQAEVTALSNSGAGQ